MIRVEAGALWKSYLLGPMAENTSSPAGYYTGMSFSSGPNSCVPGKAICYDTNLLLHPTNT